MNLTPSPALRVRTWDVVLAILLLLAVALCWLPAFNEVADDSVDAGLKRAFVSFASARTLHGAISVVQGTEVGLQPMGMGLTLTVGQALAPISDLTAQVADWMLWATVAFGMQKLLLAMGGSFWISAAVSVVALTWIGLRWRGQGPPWLSRLLVVLLFTRLVMPVTILGSEWVFEQFLKQPYQQSQTASAEAADKLKSMDANNGEVSSTLEKNPEKGWLDRLRGVFSNPSEMAREKLDQMTAAFDRMVEDLVTLIVVFALQTILIPLGLAWALLQLCKGFLVTRQP